MTNETKLKMLNEVNRARLILTDALLRGQEYSLLRDIDRNFKSILALINKN